MESADAASENEAYRAVGRYVVEFSRLIYHMRYGVERRLAIDGDRMIAAMALGEAFANQITETFFAVCEYVGKLEDDEKPVGVRLRKEVRDEIKRRNDFAHGDWMLGNMSAAYEHPVLARIKPGRKSGAIQTQELPVADIDAASDAVYTLRQKVAEFGAICLGTYPFQLQGEQPFRVRHTFRMEGHEVTRISPVAINWF